MGIGAFLWIPLSLAIGRRPVLLLASLVVLVSTICAGVERNFYLLLVALCFQGLGAGAWTSVVCNVVRY